jgi:hypothetical protein
MSARKIPRAVFEPVSDILASDLEENSVLLSLVKREVPVAIEEAFKAKKTFATLFEINTTGMFLDIPKNYWIPALEKFEDCISIKNLIEEIRKGNKTISKKTQKKQDDGAGTDTNTTSN